MRGKGTKRRRKREKKRESEWKEREGVVERKKERHRSAWREKRMSVPGGKI